MSPTSYQTAPPRVLMIATAPSAVQSVALRIPGGATGRFRSQGRFGGQTPVDALLAREPNRRRRFICGDFSSSLVLRDFKCKRDFFNGYEEEPRFDAAGFPDARNRPEPRSTRRASSLLTWPATRRQSCRSPEGLPDPADHPRED